MLTLLTCCCCSEMQILCVSNNTLFIKKQTKHFFIHFSLSANAQVVPPLNCKTINSAHLNFQALHSRDAEVCAATVLFGRQRYLHSQNKVAFIAHFILHIA